MPKRKTVEERIEELEERREDHIKLKVEAFERRLRATYQAKIDLLREKGLPETKLQRKRAHRNIDGMLAKARDRSVFFSMRYYEHMGLPPEEAKKLAETEFHHYRIGLTRAMMG